jgi:hypothetical protein
METGGAVAVLIILVGVMARASLLIYLIALLGV